MPTMFPFHSRLFISKTILFRMLSPIITRVFYFLEYIGDSEKPRLFCRSFNQTTYRMTHPRSQDFLPFKCF